MVNTNIQKLPFYVSYAYYAYFYSFRLFKAFSIGKTSEV